MHDKDINMSSDEDFDLEGPVESDGNGSSRSAENSNEYFMPAKMMLLLTMATRIMIQNLKTTRRK